MAKGGTSVGVVIRALNEEKHLGRLLTGLARQTRVPDQIVLVDSGSSDSTVAIAQSFGASVVHIDSSEFSFGRSLNFGLEACETDVALILSAHVYPIYDTFVQNMIAPLEHESVAVAYGRQVGDHRTKFAERRIMRQWFPEDGTGPQDHPFSNNANACVRRAVWEQLRYDEYLTGLEDLDFAVRAQDKGWDVWYVAEAPIVHVHEESWSQILNRYRREAIAYARLHPGWRMGSVEAIGTAGRNLLADWSHAVVERRPPRDFPESLAFRAAQFLGTWQGSASGQTMTEELRRRMYYPAGIRPFDTANRSLGQAIDYASGSGSHHVD